MTAENDSTVPYDTMSSTKYLRLTKCCCVFSLRTGCFILGYMNLVFNIVQLFAIVAFTVYIGLNISGESSSTVVETTNKMAMLGESNLQSEVAPPTTESFEPVFENLYGVPLVLALFISFTSFMITICCLIGLHKKRLGPIKVYIAFTTGRLLIVCGLFFYLIITATESYTCTISHIVDVGLSTYFLMVYYFYAKELEDERRNPPMLDVPTDIAYIYPLKSEKPILAGQ